MKQESPSFRHGECQKMTKTEAADELEFLKETFPKEPPEECDYLDEWYDSHKKLINAINMGIEALLEK